MAHIDFAILNSHVTVIYLRFIKSTIFFCGKTTNKFKIAVFFPAIYPCISNVPFLKQENLTFRNLLKEFWHGQFFYYMKLGLSASMFCQI